MTNGINIVGCGEIIERESEKTVVELFAEAMRQALTLSDINKAEIDGFITTTTMEYPPIPGWLPDQICRYFGLEPRFSEILTMGGTSFEAFIVRAALAIKMGLAKTILCVGGGRGTVRRKMGRTPPSSDSSYFEFLTRNYLAFSPTSDYALAAQRHSYEFGTSDEQRMKIAVDERQNASINPHAIFKEKLTIDDVRNSRMISSPLRLLECVMPVDGAHAFIITTDERAETVPVTPIHLIGFGEAHDPRPLQERELITVTPARLSGKAAFEMANIKPTDADVVELYDMYTITTLMELEDLGFCEKGMGGAFVEKTDLTLKGDLHLNTNGGSLNMGQPSFMSGGVILCEGLRQLMGIAGPVQVNGARIAVVSGMGGRLNHAVTLILTNNLK